MLVKAVIMAGGEGTRLRPLTVNRPKPMVPLVNKPIMEHVVDLLADQGIRDIGITLHYLPSTIKVYFADGSSQGVRFYYSMEDKPLGTAGGVRKLLKETGWNETLIIMSGDVFTNIDLKKMLEYHRRKGSVFTMAVRRVDDPTKYGITLLDEEGRIRRFLEKPSWGEVFSDMINMGIYIAEPEALKYIEDGREFDFSKNLIPILINRGEPIYGWPADKYYWSDIGSIEQYKQTHWDILEGKAHPPHPIPGRRLNGDIIVGEGVKIPNSAEIIPPVIIGSYTKIGEGSRIGPYVVIGENSIIGGNNIIEKTIIWSNVYTGYSVRITDSVIGEKARIERQVIIHEGAVIGDETRIGRGSQVKPGVKIWPFKIIDPYTIVSTNVKWGIRWYHTLIEPWGVSGLVNIEISPELAARIGLSIASILPPSSRLAVGRDTYSSSRMIKYGFTAGLLAGGVDAYDLGVVPLPVLTHYVGKHDVFGGVFSSIMLYDPDRARINIFDKDGMFIDKNTAKRIEGIFFKEAFRKAMPETMGDLEKVTGHVDEYTRDLLGRFNPRILEENPVLVDCEYGSAGIVWSEIIRKIPGKIHTINCNLHSSLKPRSTRSIYETVEAISKALPHSSIKAAFIYDSDVDKVTIITRKGTIISGDRLTALVAAILLETHGRGKIILPHMSPSIVVNTVKTWGGEIIPAEAGLLAYLSIWGILETMVTF
jgi:mannose-1-phosphate guanylyltransferase/phosphomannomutase